MCVVCVAVQSVNNRGTFICLIPSRVSLLSLSGTDVCEGIRADITLFFSRCQQLTEFLCVPLCISMFVWPHTHNTEHLLKEEFCFCVCMRVCVWEGLL